MEKRLIVGIGEALWDILPEGAKLGGAPSNFAFHTHQFGFDAMAISALGNDVLGDRWNLMTKVCPLTRLRRMWLGIIFPLHPR